MILECTLNLIEERRKQSFKERRTIKGKSPRPKISRSNKNSIYSPIKFKPFRKKNGIRRRRRYK